MTYRDLPKGAIAHRSHIVPAHQLRREIEKLIPELQRMSKGTDAMFDGSYNDEHFLGWREYLASRVSAITGKNRKAILRHIHRVMSDESAVVEAGMADAYMLACGKLIDVDTNIQTLPGNRRNAREMVILRKGELTERELQEKVEKLMVYQFRLCYPNGYRPSEPTLRYREQRAKTRKTRRQARAAA
jgi:hypothetical protein